MIDPDRVNWRSSNFRFVWASTPRGLEAEAAWASLNPAGAELHRENVVAFYEWAGPSWLATWEDIDALLELEPSDERWDS